MTQRHCRKRCYPSRAKARKALRNQNGKIGNHCKVIYECDRLYHAGQYHLTSRRVPDGKAKVEAMDGDSSQEGQGDEPAAVPPVHGSSLEPPTAQVEAD